MSKKRHIWWFNALPLLLLATPAALAAEPAEQPGDMVLGQASAPVTIIEYASMTCPHCAEFDIETFPKVKSDWIDTGKGKLIFRDFPLNEGAVSGALVAHCAPPDRFFAFVDVLFRSQEQWIASDGIHADPQALLRLARLGGISEDKFNQCLSDKTAADRILNSRLVAQKDYDVDSTPTFFINGKKVDPPGFMPYPQFAQQLEQALPGAAAAAAPTPAPPAPSHPTASPAGPMPTVPQPRPQGWWDRTKATLGAWYHTVVSHL
jgi:protein-disulfide isomerase